MVSSPALLCIAALFSLMFAGASSAEQLGPTHRITEPDLLEDIYAALHKKENSGELKRLEKEAIVRAQKTALEPPPIARVKRTELARRFYWDPTFVADKDVRDHTGKIIVKRGTRLNPLDHVTLPMNFLFFDGRDPEQIAYAKFLLAEYKGGVRPIMTGGHIANTSRELNVRMYFDQGGYLIRRFGIEQVPAMVSQEKDSKKLRIDEMRVPDTFRTIARGDLK